VVTAPAVAVAANRPRLNPCAAMPITAR